MYTKFSFLIFLIVISCQVRTLSQSADEITVVNVEQINSPSLEFSPAFYHHGLVYVSSQYRTGRKDNKIGENTFDLLYSDLGPGGKLSKSGPLALKVNTPYHEGPVSFTANMNKMFFTRSNFENDVLKADEDGKIRLKIFEAVRGKDDWEGVTSLPFNSNEYSSIHPSISRDGNRLYFASDRPDGYGGMDLYYVERVNGAWSKPVNLGPTINTSEHEVFPYIHQSGKLFFSSYRKGGPGGLDILMADVSGDQPGKPELLPAPINSPEDDLGIMMNAKGTMGYFSSSRPGGKGKDDIYRFDAPGGLKGINPAQQFKAIVQVRNRETGQTLNGALIQVIQVPEGKTIYSMNEVFQPQLSKDEDGNVVVRHAVRDQLFDREDAVISDQDGRHTIRLTEHSKFLILAKKEGFQTGFEEYIAYATPETAPVIEIGLWPAPKPVVPEPPMLEVGSIIVLDQIYYDFDKSYIRTDASRGLNTILLLMQQNPDMKIALTAHTDSRGTTAYNKDLSERRAASAKYYLTSRGIQSDRIQAAGKGESEPRNRCKDGVRCTEVEHQYNRRTEIRITYLGNPPRKVRYIDNPPEYIDVPGKKRN